MIAEFFTPELMTISMLSLLSALVTSILGFGAGLVLTPLLTFILPLREALGIGALIYLATSAAKTYWFLPDVNRMLWARALPTALIGLGCGMLIIQLIPGNLLNLIFSAVLLFYAISNLFGKSEAAPLLPKPCYPFLAGVSSILVHAAGLFFFRYCRMNNADRVQTVATMAALHFSLNIFKALFFTTSGLVDSKYIVLLLPAYLFAIIGTRLGKTILIKHVSEKAFTVGVSIMLILLSTKMIYGTF